MNKPNTIHLGTRDTIKFEVDGRKQSTNYTWFRGEHCNYNPKKRDLLDHEAVLRHVLHGWMPAQPAIGPSTKVTAFGSCFAANITRWLNRRKYTVLTADEKSEAYVVRLGEGMVTTFALRQQFEWGFEGKRPKGELWHGYSAEAFGYDESIRQETRDIFDRTDVFILTLGLSEVWYLKETGEVLWRAPPASQDQSLYGLRMSTVEDNNQNLRAIYDLIRKYKPDAKIIVTLSPIPLNATFRPISCMTANSASKAILRAAIDEVFREIGQEDILHYWPSYEIVLDVFGDRWQSDRRHAKPEILRFIMTLFESVWCQGVAPETTLEEAWATARAASGSLPPGLVRALEARNAQGIRRLAKRLAALESHPRDVQLLKDLAASLEQKGPAPLAEAAE